MKIEVTDLFAIVLSIINLILIIYQFIKEGERSKKVLTIKAIGELMKDPISKLDEVIKNKGIDKVADSYMKPNKSQEVKDLKFSIDQSFYSLNYFSKCVMEGIYDEKIVKTMCIESFCYIARECNRILEEKQKYRKDHKKNEFELLIESWNIK